MKSMLFCLLCCDSTYTSAAVSCEASDEAHSGLGLSGLTVQCSTATQNNKKKPGWFEMRKEKTLHTGLR